MDRAEFAQQVRDVLRTEGAQKPQCDDAGIWAGQVQHLEFDAVDFRQSSLNPT